MGFIILKVDISVRVSQLIFLVHYFQLIGMRILLIGIENGNYYLKNKNYLTIYL